MKTKKPYIITADLEKTGLPELDPTVASLVLQDIRMNTANAINKALGTDITKIYTYQEIFDWTNNVKNSKNEFSISVDNGVYMKDADFYFNSTRMYQNKESILQNPNSYKIRTRDGGDISDQYMKLDESYKNKKIIIYDDGIFSGDTLKDTITFIQTNPRIQVSEIRVVLNFSGKDNLGGIPIKALYSGDCTDWIDERDFFYGVNMGGASIQGENQISGVPYISSTQLATKKASITNNASKFCLSMLSVNQEFWRIKQATENRIIRLMDIPRLQYLLSNYSGSTEIENLLEQEKSLI